MKYTAFALILVGVVIACFAGYGYASSGPPGLAGNLSATSLILLLAFAAVLAITGVGIWVYGGKGYSVSGPNAARSPIRN